MRARAGAGASVGQRREALRAGVYKSMGDTVRVSPTPGFEPDGGTRSRPPWSPPAVDDSTVQQPTSLS